MNAPAPSTSAPLIDCRGLQCPAPILKLSEAARAHRATASTLTVLATDTDFPVDLEAWCRTTKASLVRLEHEQDGVIRAQIRLPGAPAPAPAPVPVADTLSSGAREPVPAAPARQPLPGSQKLDLTGLPIAAAMRKVGEVSAARPGERWTLLSDAHGFEGRLAAWAGAMEATLESIHGEGDHAVAVVRFPGEPQPAVMEPAILRQVHVQRAEPQPGNAAVAVPGGSRSMVIQPLLPRQPVAARAEPSPAPLPEAPVALAQLVAEPSPAPLAEAVPRENRATLLVLHNDLEALLAALMVANASAAQGMHVEMYFAFWGIHLLRGERPRMSATHDKPGLMQRMLLWMVPKGPSRQKLGKLHMGGLGTRILLGLMRKKNILALDKLIEAAVNQGVEFKVCSMSMGLMGLSQRDIINLPNLDFAGVTSFAESAGRSAVSLVF